MVVPYISWQWYREGDHGITLRWDEVSLITHFMLGGVRRTPHMPDICTTLRGKGISRLNKAHKFFIISYITKTQNIWCLNDVTTRPVLRSGREERAGWSCCRPVTDVTSRSSSWLIHIIFSYSFIFFLHRKLFDNTIIMVCIPFMVT